MIALRDAAPEDLDELVALDVAAFGRTAWSRDAMAGELAEAGRSRVVVVASEHQSESERGAGGSGDGSVRGFAIVLVADDVADLQRLVVAERTRSRGVGSLLLTEVIGRAAGRRCREMLLEVGVDNQPAVRFYERRGFAEMARRPRYYADGTDALVMRRALDGAGISIRR